MAIYAESAIHDTDVLPYGEGTFQIIDEESFGRSVIAYCHEDNAERIVAALIAADTAEPAPAAERVNCIITHIKTVPCDGGWIEIVSFSEGWGYLGESDCAYTPVRHDFKEPFLTQDLRRIEGHDVALWLTPEDANGRREIVTFNTFGKSE
jgi:hypothetical protein